MAEVTIKATCSCGATLEVSGGPPATEYRYLDFLGAHKGCARIEAGSTYAVEGAQARQEGR